jgi:hypothetical protein
MLYLKRFLIVLFWAVVFVFLHYTLPQRDIARVVGTEVRRVDFGENSWFWAGADSGQDSATINRDIRFINAVRKQTYFFGLMRGRDDVMVYRNEDTGVGWPPYFKLDSSNLQTEADDLKSSKAEPQWAVVTHYGWRNEWFSIFPNAVGIKPIDNPDRFLFPWFNALLLLILAGIGLGFYRLTQYFRRNTIDPIVEDVGEGWDSATDYADERRGRIGAWLDTWRSKPPR